MKRIIKALAKTVITLAIALIAMLVIAIAAEYFGIPYYVIAVPIAASLIFYDYVSTD